MECEAHAGRLTTSSCGFCGKPRCDRCMVYEVEGTAACTSCGANQRDRSHALGSMLLALVGCGYLATLAVAYVVFRGRPFVGGLAAVVAITFGRVLQGILKLPRVTRVG